MVLFVAHCHAVLGIDSAWTEGQPSGVALIAKDFPPWRCLGVAPSYESFVELAAGRPVDWSAPATGGAPDLAVLQAAVRKLVGYKATLIAVDMPLSKQTITGRRAADNEISRKFGAAKCSVHSPTPTRPGPLADLFRTELADRFPLATKTTKVGEYPALLEVYPHVGLLKLMNAKERLPYKVASSSRHTPGSPDGRVHRIVEQQGKILDELGKHIQDIPPGLAIGSARATTLASLKKFEDAIDALVCAWIGGQYLDDNASAHGDDDAAIWVPGPAPKPKAFPARDPDLPDRRLRRNKENAMAFYDLMFNRCRPRQAVQLFVGAHYRQHNPHVGDGKQAFVEYFDRMAREYPGKSVTFERAFAEGDHVVLHCHQRWPGDEDYAGIDIFRFDGDGKIVEHWDVLQVVPKQSKNKNSMF